MKLPANFRAKLTIYLEKKLLQSSLSRLTVELFFLTLPGHVNV